MRILYINQGDSIYGASRSLGLLMYGIAQKIGLENIFLVNDFTAKKANIKNKHLQMCKNRYYWILPSLTLVIDIKRTYKFYINGIIRFIIAYLFYASHYKKIIQKERINIVHLNNEGLWPMLMMLPKSVIKVIHIRGHADVRSNSILNKLMLNFMEKADKVIAIGEAEASYYPTLKNVIVLNNPVDMSEVKNLNNKKSELFLKYGLDVNKKTVAFIGYLNEHKGVSFILDAFESLMRDEKNRRQIQLVVAGRASKSKLVMNRLQKAVNTTYAGEVQEVEEIYAICDAVVRGETFLPLGRTVYEAIYAGKKAILPCDDPTQFNIPNIGINKQVFFYKPRDIVSLNSCIIASLFNEGDIEREASYSNLDEYTLEILRIYHDI